MSEPICVDASVILSLVLDEELSDRVDALWNAWSVEGRRLVAPRVIRFEVGGLLERKMKSGQLGNDLVRMSVSAAESLIASVEQPEITGGLRTAWDMAEQYRLRILDACYFAVARQENAELWTLDQELAKRAGGKMP